MNYKGYVIEEETNPWALKHGFKFQYLKGPETIYGAKSLNEAAAEIDELTCNDPTAEEPAGILLTSLKEMVAEFKKPEWEIWCDHSVGICACGPISILERAENAIKWAAALEANPSVITDKLKIAVQCIEANRQEFKYRMEHAIRPASIAVCEHHVQLCANALKAIQQ